MSTRARLLTAVLLIVAVVLLRPTSDTIAPDPEQASDRATQAAEPTPQTPPTPTGEPGPASPAETTTPETPTAAPSHHPPAPGSEDRAAAAAVAFARAYLADLPEPEWIAGLEDLVTPELGTALATVDPDNVPAAEILDLEVRGVSDLAAAVDVDTSAGRLRVELTHLGRHWLVHRVDPSDLQ
ncbi:MAG: hypothetical protein Q8Q29_11995 [Actinomycetota bacterium]|nr:hypothetical protein [Actinomycetota bacterium]